MSQPTDGAPKAGDVEFVPVHPLTFTYRNWKGEVSVRRVQPIEIRFAATSWHPVPQYLLRAFDVDKGEIRDFAWVDISPAPAEPAAATAPDPQLSAQAQADRRTARRGIVVAFTIAILAALAAPYLFNWLAGR